jgi:hypothetical protein
MGKKKGLGLTKKAGLFLRQYLSKFGLMNEPDAVLVEANDVAETIIRELARQGFIVDKKVKDKRIIKKVCFHSPIAAFPDRFELKVDIQRLPEPKAAGDLKKDEVMVSLRAAFDSKNDPRGVRLKEGDGVIFVVSRALTKRENYYYKDIVAPKGYDPKKNAGLIPLGRDDLGHPVFADLFKMPHMGVAGATGGGKSSALHTILCWLAENTDPNYTKFVLIDLKRLDLSRYNILPHMAFPVAIDMGPALNALQWMRDELIRRSDKFLKINAVDYETYISKTGEMIPRIVFVLDDIIAFDDLKLTDKDEYNRMVALIRVGAGQARALGIHFIIGTQRPDVSVIDGTARANITHWLAFGTKTDLDSRIILDNNMATGLPIGDCIYQSQSVGADRNKYLRSPYVDVKKDEVDGILKRVKAKWEIAASDRYRKDEEKAAKHAEIAKRIIAFCIDKYKGECPQDKVYEYFKDEITQNDFRGLLREMEARGILEPGVGTRPRRVVINLQENLQDGKPALNSLIATPA